MANDIRGLAAKVDMQDSIRQEKLDKMPFKKAFKSECSAEFADSDYPFSWRGKKFNCLHKESKKIDEAGYKP